MKTFGFVTLLTGCLALLACSALAAVDQDRRQPPGEREAQQPARELPQAFITSKRVVYGYGQPIDLTFSIATPKDGEVLPDFKIVRIAPAPEEGEAEVIVEPREVNGLHFWEATGESFDGKKRIGALPVGQTYTETIADLRQWYDFDATGPGTYRITFAGEWIVSPLPPGEGPGVRAHGREVEKRHALTSNTIIVRIARPPSEDEPFGEPMEGRLTRIEDIWATRMPGLAAKPLEARIGEGGFRPPDCNLVEEIMWSLSRERRSNLPAFIVRGNQMDALREAHSVLVGGNAPETSFRQGEGVWLVFFTKHSTPFIVLDRVENHGPVIEIKYLVVKHFWHAGRMHLAMVPLRLPHAGNVRVEMKPEFRWVDSVMPMTIDAPPSPEAMITPQVDVSQSFDVEVLR